MKGITSKNRITSSEKLIGSNVRPEVAFPVSLFCLHHPSLRRLQSGWAVLDLYRVHVWYINYSKTLTDKKLAPLLGRRFSRPKSRAFICISVFQKNFLFSNTRHIEYELISGFRLWETGIPLSVQLESFRFLIPKFGINNHD